MAIFSNKNCLYICKGYLKKKKTGNKKHQGKNNKHRGK